jgi:2-polyprenyl-3-methyl-5-hydroxy-6-metoxy-1,4-benzoquinol methylase
MDRSGVSPDRPSCRVCNSTNVAPFRARHGLYGRCRVCQSILRLVSAAEYQNLNPTYDAGPFRKIDDAATLASYLAVDEKVNALRGFFGRGLDGRSFLDIGCGMGGYLIAAQRLGMKPIGIEPSEAHAHIPRTLLNLDVRVGYFSPSAVEGQTFDAVMVSHVVEHIFDPRPFIADVMKVVAPGGRAVFITPNARSTVTHLTRSAWVMLDPVDHVTMLTEAGFRALGVEDHGDVRFSQSEYTNEALFTLGATIKQQVRGRFVRAAPPPTSAQPHAAPVPGGVDGSSLRRRRFASVLRSLPLGLPIHWLNRALQLQACLICTVRKPAI